VSELTSQLFRRKPVVEMEAESGSETEQSELTRSIGLFQLTMFGVGATIGTGIFFVLSQAVPIAGPAVVFSFLIAALVAGLTAVCYAELAGAVPVSGSSYSYAYATIGELPAMVVAGCLLLEYGVSAAAVAVGWSEYLNELLDNTLGVRIPEALSQAPEQGGIFNLPAVILIGLCTLLLIRGASESAKVNTVMVLIKISILILFVIIGLFGWNSNNLADFAPFGVQGITAAAGVIFFSFIGIDAVSTAGEEVKHPHRTMPLAIIFALLIVTTLYVLVSLVAVAAQPYTQFEGQEAGLAAILENVVGATWPGTLWPATECCPSCSTG
jgi:amino acid transporter